MSAKSRSIVVQGRSVVILSSREDDFISLTDIARYRNTGHTDDLIRNWLRNRTPWNSWAFGSISTTLALFPWNATELECRLAAMAGHTRILT